jgi:GxxExxY protein
MVPWRFEGEGTSFQTNNPPVASRLSGGALAVQSSAGGEGDMTQIQEPLPEVDRLARAVIDAAVEVHRTLGPGYLESVYEEACAIEFSLRKIPFERQRPISVDYKGHPVGEGRIDLIVGGALLVELKAVESLAPIQKAQVISYLKTTGLTLGLLINFNVAVLKHGIQRIVLS